MLCFVCVWILLSPHGGFPIKTLGLNKGVEFVVLIFCVLDSTIKRGNGLFLSLILFLVVVFEVLLMVLMVDFWVGMMYRIWIL